MNDKTRLNIVKKVKELRLKRSWTQVQLAHTLGLSQSRFSEIENGQGSFTAEQLIEILKAFNVSLDYFVEIKTTVDDQLQKMLARLGANLLQEDPNVLPTERIKEVITVLREVIATGRNPRLITALAAVIVNHSDPSILEKLFLELFDLGFYRRYFWVLENTLDALKRELYANSQTLPSQIKLKYKRTETAIEDFLNFHKSTSLIKRKALNELNDIWVNEEISSKESFKEIKKQSSKISIEWRIVTRIQPEDFVEALRYARNDH